MNKSATRYFVATHKYLYTDETKTVLVDSLAVEGWSDKFQDNDLKAKITDAISTERQMNDLREKLKKSLNEYVGFPPYEVPSWVDWELALDDIETQVKEHYKDYRELHPDQSLPKEIISCGFGCEELLKDWRRIKEE